jgi:hypothetical protein
MDSAWRPALVSPVISESDKDGRELLLLVVQFIAHLREVILQDNGQGLDVDMGNWVDSSVGVEYTRGGDKGHHTANVGWGVWELDAASVEKGVFGRNSSWHLEHGDIGSDPFLWAAGVALVFLLGLFNQLSGLIVDKSLAYVGPWLGPPRPTESL